MNYKTQSNLKKVKKFGIGLLTGITFLLNPIYLDATQNEYHHYSTNNRSERTRIEIPYNEVSINESANEAAYESKNDENIDSNINEESVKESISYTDCTNCTDITENLQLTRINTNNTENTSLFDFLPYSIEEIILQGYIDFRHKPIQLTRNSNIKL